MAGRWLILAAGTLVLVLGIAIVSGIAWTTGADPVVSLSELEVRGVIHLESHDVFLVYNDGDPLALSADAQHLGDLVEFCESSQMFESPAHGEKFDLRGYYYGGPAGSGLDRYPVRVEGDGVYVDLDHPTQGPPRGSGQPLEPAGPFCVH